MAQALSRLILTRPDPENQAWLEALTQAKVKAVAWPLIRIAPHPKALAQLQNAWQQLDQCKAAMFVSRPAVQHFFAVSDPAHVWPSRTRAWCTGPGTRNALLDQGVPAQLIDVPPSTGVYDTDHLWPVVQHQIQAQDTVLLVRGGEAGEQQVGLASEAATDGSVWLFSSSQAVANLNALLPQQEWSKAKALATHPRIAQRAQDMGFGQVGLTQPTVEAVLASIES